jgi:hypothetical protein
MNQVFISNNRAGQILSAKTWSDMVHLAGGADDGSATAMFGVWDPYGQVFFDGTTAALSLIAGNNLTALTADSADPWALAQKGSIIADATAIAAGQEVANSRPSSPNWLNKAFQLVQAMPSGNPVASPIIHTNQVKRLRWDPNNPPVKHKITAAASGLTSIASGDTLQLIVVLRFPGDITRYEAQINPSGTASGVTPALSHAFDNPKRIYRSAEYVAVSATAADEHNAFADLVIADNASGKNSFSDFITTSLSTNDLVLEAKFDGLIIDAFVVKNGDKSHTAGETTAPELGVGSYAEVLSNEKKAQYSQGFFNRMYLPTGGVTSASKTPGGVSSTETANYDRLTIEYVNPDGGMPGFNKQGRYSTATVYFPANGDHSDQSEGLAIEATWGLINAPAGPVEFIW